MGVQGDVGSKSDINEVWSVAIKFAFPLWRGNFPTVI